MTQQDYDDPHRLASAAVVVGVDGSEGSELALRWAGIGFLVGLGLWIDPLISYACAAIAISSTVSRLIVPCSQSISTQSKPRRPAISTICGDSKSSARS